MKSIKLLSVVIILAGILLSACAGAPAAPAAAPISTGGGKALYSEVVFAGVIESMNGDQWVVNGQTIKVDSSTVRDGSFLVGDTVKVEAVVAADGSITARRVESPSAADLVEMTAVTPDDSSTSASAGLVFDDSGTEAVGTVESITDTSITIGGQTFPFAQGVQIKGAIVAGALVKLHFVVNADGTLSVTEIEPADSTGLGDDNGNDDNSNSNSNGNNSNDDNSNNDNGNSNDDNGNDDSKGNNSNDDDSNDDNGNDDNNDDNSNDNNNNG